MSDYRKNVEHFQHFCSDFEGYFDRYVYVYYKNKNDFLLWFMIDEGDFVFGNLEGLGGISFFFDKQIEADTIEFAHLKGLIIEKSRMKLCDLEGAALEKLKRKIKRNLKDPQIIPEGVMPDPPSKRGRSRPGMTGWLFPVTPVRPVAPITGLPG